MVSIARNSIPTSVLEAVDFRAASALPLPLPPKRSYFISSYPTHLFGSGCHCQPLLLPLPSPWLKGPSVHASISPSRQRTFGRMFKTRCCFRSIGDPEKNTHSWYEPFRDHAMTASTDDS